MTATERTAAIDPTHRREEVRVRSIEDTFRAEHGPREFKNSYRNVLRLLSTSYADPAQVRAVAKEIGLWGAHNGPFDHGRLFGRDGRPTVLVGHPYQLDMNGPALLDDIRCLGLRVDVNPKEQSFYGFGTLQVVVYALGLNDG